MTRVLMGLLLLLVLVYDVSTVPGVRSQTGFDPWLDGWVQVSAYVVAAAVAALRGWRGPAPRDFWRLIAVAIAFRALGFVLYVPWIRTLVPQPYPSLADLAWLLASSILLIGLLHRLSVRAPRTANPLILDAFLGAVTTAALAVALLFGVLGDLTAGSDTSATITNVAYPVVDVATLVVVLALMIEVSWRPSTARAVLTVGVVIGAVVDCVYLYQVSTAAYRPGTWLSALALTGTAIAAASGWLSDEGRTVRPRTSPPNLIVPALCSLVCIGILVYESVRAVPVTAIVLAVAGLALAVIRTVLANSWDRRAAEKEIIEATDEMLRFQALVETSGDFIAMADADGHVVYVNPAGRRMVGLSRDVDVRTTVITDYLTEEGQRDSREVEQPAVLAHGHWEGEGTLRDHGGGPAIPVAISSFLMRHPTTGEPFALATVQRDLSERLAQEHAVRVLAEDRRLLLARLTAAQEDERARIAADVHDDSVQTLAALQLRLALLRKRASSTAPGLVDGIDASLTTLKDASERLRALLFDLEAPAAETDLTSAIESAAGHLFEGSGVSVAVRGDRPTNLPEAARITGYRIAKEALMNVRKHADAERVVVEVREDDEGVLVTVIDDGRGIEPSEMVERHGHLGLTSMRDRAVIAGGRFDVSPRPGRGTRVMFWLPS